MFHNFFTHRQVFLKFHIPRVQLVPISTNIRCTIFTMVIYFSHAVQILSLPIIYKVPLRLPLNYIRSEFYNYTFKCYSSFTMRRATRGKTVPWIPKLRTADLKVAIFLPSTVEGFFRRTCQPRRRRSDTSRRRTQRHTCSSLISV